MTGLFDDLIPAPARNGVPAGFDAHLAGLESRYRLPAGTLGAVMAVESGGNPDAVSPAGARGVFQFMPATAQRFGIDPLDPYQAADGAARYLRANLDQFGDRLDLALAGYNAGENRQSLREGRIPEIPETQAYVRKVMARLPGGNAPAPAAGGLFDDLIPTPAATSAAAAPPAGATSAPPSLDAPAAQAAPPESVPDGGLFADLIPQPPGAQGDGLSRAVGDGRAVWPAEPNPAVASGFVPPAAGTPAFDAAAVRAEAGPVDDSVRGLLTRLARVFGGGFTQTLSPTEQIGLAADTAAGGQQVQLLGRDPAAQLVPGKSTAEQAAFLSGALAKQGLDPLNLLLALGGGAAGPAGRVLQGAAAGGAQGAGAEVVTQLLPAETVQALRAAGLGHLVSRDGGFDLAAVLRAGLENAALGAGFDAVMGGGAQALRAVDGRLPAPVRDTAAGGAGGTGGASGAASAVDPALASVGPDGVVVPNREVVDGLPGLDGRAVRDVPAAAAAAPAEAGAVAPAGAATATPDAGGAAAPGAGAAAPEAVPARAAPRATTVLAGDGGDLTAVAGARAAEFERLAGLATDPEVAAALRRLADGAPPPSSATREVVVTPGGRSVETEFQVIDAADLVTSDRPEFPAELQPRERGQRVASDAQIAGIAGRLDPEQLAGSRLASTGAPIVGPDGVVESGNGRVAAIRRAYGQDGPQAQAYREMLARMGFDIEGMQAPVLIRRRTSELTPEERVAFTVDANRDATAALSVAEQARADARALDDTALGMWASGAASDAGNVGFAREFIRQTGADPAAMLTADGRLSAEGVRRIDAAWLARAYDDADLLGRLLEDPEPNIKAIGGAYLDAAPAVARLRAGVARGEVPAELDLAPGMTEAARLVAQARRERRALSEVIAQGDMLGGGASAEARAVLGLLFRDGELRRTLSRERMGEVLNFYAERAAEVRDGAALFEDLPAVTLDDVLAATRRQKDAITARLDENSAPAEPGGAAAGAGGEAAGATARGSGSAAAGGPDGSPTAAGARAAGPEEDAPLLSGYDAAGLRAREQARTAAEAARLEAERRAEVQRTADDFSLTGSDRPADANPGQADLLDVTGRPERKPAVMPEPAAVAYGLNESVNSSANSSRMLEHKWTWDKDNNGNIRFHSLLDKQPNHFIDAIRSENIQEIFSSLRRIAKNNKITAIVDRLSSLDNGGLKIKYIDDNPPVHKDYKESNGGEFNMAQAIVNRAYKDVAEILGIDSSDRDVLVKIAFALSEYRRINNSTKSINAYGEILYGRAKPHLTREEIAHIRVMAEKANGIYEIAQRKAFEAENKIYEEQAKNKLFRSEGYGRYTSPGIYDPVAHEITLYKTATAHTALHEIVHALTVREIEIHASSAGVSRLRSLFGIVKEEFSKSGMSAYPFNNIQEFVAEAFSNLEFQRYLSSLKTSPAVNLLSRFVDSIARLLGISGGHSNALAEVIRAVDSGIFSKLDSKAARIAEDRPRPVERPAAGTIYDPQPLRAADGAVALGRTVKHVEVGRLPSGLRAVQDAADVAHAIAGIRRDAQEALYAVVTDAAGQVLRVARVARGAVTEAPIDAGGVAGAITSTPGAARAWIAHNHPSGVVRQSAADTALAQRLADLLDGTGIEFGGSVVVGPGGRVASLGAEMVTTRPAARRDALAVSERRLSGRQTQTQPVTSSQEAHAAATQAGGSADGVLLLDAQMRPVGWVEMTGGEMRELRTGAGGGSARLQAAMDEVNAVAMIPRTESRAAVGNLHAFGQAVGREMVDALDRSGRSWERRGEIPTQSTFYANPLAPAAAQLARDVRAAAGPAALAAAGGAVYGATRSDAEVGTARWWLDVVAGGGLGATVAATARGLHLVGRDSFAARSLSRLGTWIDELPLIGRGSAEVRELKAKQRLMREILDRQTAEVGKVLRDRFTPAERAQIADLIEERGYVRELGRVHRQAAELDDYLRHVGERMKTLGMLPQELDLGGYLHRYYAKHLGLDADGKAARRQSLSGSYSIARGTEEIFPPEMLSPGVRERLARIEQLQADLDGARRRQQRKGTAGDLAVDEIRAELHALRGEPVHEYIGEQGGEPRSFFFTADEVPHVDVSGLGLRPEGNRTRAPANPGEGLPSETGARLSTTERVWTVRGTREGAAVLHRDWTKAERQHWGEIEDAGYRYVRGMAEASHDLSLATMFKAVAERPAWASREARPGWVAVPDSRIGKGSALRRYGALAGMFVEPKVWAAIRSYARPVLGDGRVATEYMGALRRWKAWHTVYNPVTHFNNLHSNTEMLFLSGYGPADLGRGLREMIRGERSPVWREARDAGLFERDFAAAELHAKAGPGGSELTRLADELLHQTDDADVSATVGRLMRVKEWAIRSRGALAEARGPWQTGAALAQAVAGPLRVAKAPLDAVALAARKLYTLEDELFKSAVFAAERRKGASVAQAVEVANRYFFDYSDVPEAVRIARDFPIGSPFISYTYKAIPAIARTFAERPERALALAAAYEAINYAALTTAGMQPGEYWAVRRAEDDLAPEWERGRAIWGGLNNVHIPYMDGYRLALGNAHAAGNPFASEGGERRASLPVPGLANVWGSDVFGGNPLHALLDVTMNEDWKGREIYKPGAPVEDKARKIASYLYQAFAPSNVLTPGGYQQQRVLEGLAADAQADGMPSALVEQANAFAAALGFEGFTGERADGSPAAPSRDAVLASFGVKIRPVDLDAWQRSRGLDARHDVREVQDWQRDRARKAAQGRISDAQREQGDELAQRDIGRMQDRAGKAFDAADFLRGRFPTK